jgi:16S rRNA (cytidine1402-2'-O)-methyltransferase
MAGMSGKLYVIATPIGNLGDITLRAIEVLGNVDLVVAEDRERALKLLNHLGIRKPLVTINSYNEQRKTREITHRILDGNNVALITGAGTPCVSDPGVHVVNGAYEAEIEVAVVPGPSAVAAAISASGLHTDKFIFLGFLPQKKGKKKKIFRELGALQYPLIFFESPRRLVETLRCVAGELGGRRVAVFKEMTKVYEQVFRGTPDDLLNQFSDGELKGEYTVIVEGRERIS